MKKLLLSALAGLSLFAAQAGAATYYIKPQQLNAADTNPGTATLPWKTFAGGNATLLPGDVVYCYPGQYTTNPAPDSAGSNPTGNGYITYIGVNPVADALTDSVARNAIVITSEPPGSASYISMKGFKIGGNGNAMHFGEDADRDSMQYITADYGPEIYGGDYNVVRFCIFNGDRISVGSQTATPANGTLHTAGNYIGYNHFWKLGKGVVSDQHAIMFGNACHRPDENSPCDAQNSYCDSLTFERNRCFITYEATAGDVYPWYMYVSNHVDVLHNYFDLTQNKVEVNQQVCHFPRLRDSTYAITFRGDTLLAHGVGSASMTLSSHGQSIAGKEVWGVTVDSCYVDFTKAGYPSYVWLQEHMNGYSFTYNTIAMNGPLLRLERNLKGENTFDHNTFFATDLPMIDLYDPAASVHWPAGGLTFTNNLVASAAGANSGSGNGLALIRFSAVDLDSSTKMHGQDRATFNNNLYAIAPYGTVTGDRSIAILNGSDWWYSRPGDSTATNAQGLADNRYGLDSLSVYGSARLVDSTLASFDPTLGYGSAAKGIGSSGSDAGAQPYDLWNVVTAQPNAIDFIYGQAETRIVNVCNVGDATATYAVILEPEHLVLGYNTNALNATGLSITESNLSVEAGGCSSVHVVYDGIGPRGTYKFLLPGGEHIVPIDFTVNIR